MSAHNRFAVPVAELDGVQVRLDEQVEEQVPRPAVSAPRAGLLPTACGQGGRGGAAVTAADTDGE